MLDKCRKYLKKFNKWQPGRFLLAQLTHSMLTLSILALLFVGARQVGALDTLLAPTIQSVGSSATTINYQGRLSDESGVSLDGQYDLKFAIYDAAEGGAMVWPTDGEPELHEDVTVSDSLFSVGLGSRTTGGIPTNVWSGDRYLQVWVESEELSPRELLRSVPVAGMALTVPDGAITNEKMALTHWHEIVNGVEVTSKSEDNPDEVLSVDVDFPTDGTFLILIKAMSKSNESDRQVIVDVFDGGSRIGFSRIVNTHPVGGWGGRETGFSVVVKDFTAGEHTIKLKAYTNADSGADIAQATLTIIPFGKP